LATSNNKFLVKNGLSVGGASGIVDVIDSTGAWIGATGTLQGASGPQGASGISGASGYVGSDGASGVKGDPGDTGATGPLAYLTYGDIDMGTILEPANISIDLGTF
jgi:hypothetical protein